MADNPNWKEALKNLLFMNDYLNDSYEQEFGEESPYKIDSDSEKVLRDIVNKIDEDKQK